MNSEDQIKGYQVGKDDYIAFEPEEIAAAMPESDKRLTVSAFVDQGDIDDVYFDRPYYVAPSDRSGDEAFELIREGLRVSKTAAIARAVLFRRMRTLLLRPYEAGIAATTLNFDYEVRSAKEAFAEVPAIEIKGEMLELAEHIIKTKRGAFDPAKVRRPLRGRARRAGQGQDRGPQDRGAEASGPPADDGPHGGVARKRCD